MVFEHISKQKDNNVSNNIQYQKAA